MMGAGTLAFIIFAFVVAQVAVLMGIGVFRQRRKYQDREMLPGKLLVAGTAKELATTEPAWGQGRAKITPGIPTGNGRNASIMMTMMIRLEICSNHALQECCHD
ncbi:MAG: hypothetical protein OEU74_06735 [Gammaproteobacteria bacterium]|nr:hypothetical protein [Gammaproteobacteria bacterium]